MVSRAGDPGGSGDNVPNIAAEGEAADQRSWSSAPDLLTPPELSVLLQVPLNTLYYWKSRGDGPRAHRIGKHLRFAKADVLEWLERQRAS